MDVPRKAPGKLDVGTAVGPGGSLTVIKDIGLKEPYVGSIQLVGGEIAEDVAAYFVESEQIPTACALGVLIAPDQSVQAAGGYLIQLLPGADDAVITAIEQGIARVGAVSAQLDRGLGPEQLLREVLSGFELEVLDTAPVEYRCYCSRERVSRALVSMGQGELRALIQEQGRRSSPASSATRCTTSPGRSWKGCSKTPLPDRSPPGPGGLPRPGGREKKLQI